MAQAKVELYFSKIIIQIKLKNYLRFDLGQVPFLGQYL